MKSIARAVLPESAKRPLRAWLHRPQRVAWGNWRRLRPFSRFFGLDRGQPLDRYYIEFFLAEHRSDIGGRTLEIAGPDYTVRFGGKRVTRADVLHFTAGNPSATLVGDLSTGTGVPQDAFDCIILTQTLQFIPDVSSAIRHVRQALHRGGVVLATVPGISQISRYDADRWGDYWRFTEQSATRLFGDVFGLENVAVQSHGNVLVACAFLQGLAAHELTADELVFRDPDFPVLITVRAVKAV